MKQPITVLYLLLAFSNPLAAQELPNYSTYSNHFDVDEYVKQYDRKFDAQGIVTQKNEYHALTISFYGILCYHEFDRTGDSTYYWKVKDQFKYFSDTNLVEISVDGKLMGLPYHFNFHDLKAPWYSGMTQGTALSFVLRYYNLTKDSHALTVAQQLTAFMLRPETEGGTIGMTPEGFQTIEEYPNSKSNKQVLNGFVNGLIGIHEYLLYFPEDTLAKTIFQQSYDGLFASLNAYNTPTWTYYNRNKKAVSNQYMRYQLAEFEHLYEIFNDIRFIEEMHIWGMMAYGKFDNQLQFYINPLFQFSVPLVPDNSTDTPLLKFTPKLSEKEEMITKPLVNRTITKKRTPIEITTKSAVNRLAFHYDQGIDTCLISFKNIDRSEYTFSINSSMQIVSVQFKEALSAFSMSYKKRGKGLATSDWNAYEWVYDKYDNPFFVYTTGHIFEVAGGKEYSLQIEKVNTPNMKCYFRFTAKKEDLAKSNWDIVNQINLDKFSFTANGFVEIMISYDVNQEPTSISVPKLVAM